jgi:Tfp pilus assembly protein PilN
MSQPPIDLMPEWIRTRGQAHVVIVRYAASLVAALFMLFLPATHSRLLLRSAERDRVDARECEWLVRQAEQRGAELAAQLEARRARKDRYQQVALPLEISRVLATVVNEMPGSAALDRVDVRVSSRQPPRGGRRRPGGPGTGRRLLGELSGYARTDREIADFVASLEGLSLCEHVALDFTRSRTVADQPAREFRISFSVDLERKFEVLPRVGERQADAGEGGDVQ